MEQADAHAWANCFHYYAAMGTGQNLGRLVLVAPDSLYMPKHAEMVARFGLSRTGPRSQDGRSRLSAGRRLFRERLRTAPRSGWFFCSAQTATPEKLGS